MDYCKMIGLWGGQKRLGASDGAVVSSTDVDRLMSRILRAWYLLAIIPRIWFLDQKPPLADFRLPSQNQ